MRSGSPAFVPALAAVLLADLPDAPAQERPRADDTAPNRSIVRTAVGRRDRMLREYESAKLDRRYVLGALETLEACAPSRKCEAGKH